jgi:hypothetical protein
VFRKVRKLKSGIARMAVNVVKCRNVFTRTSLEKVMKTIEQKARSNDCLDNETFSIR